ncbi:uncharacterized protein LOC131681998 isoform X2 [Topomyia yanbarensis]|uniref:uncharacterized protein LOC131681998 isoform X2 n=1 Tax=Topomyia yanbarensis TaxID=2498891 RepID=UPI00273A9DB8|nr:uncharacterized protein LOC131681998 isoform X2 [Topomyia yanbarensis]
MEESHRNIMDHLDLGTGSHHLQEDLSKGVLRTIHNVENGTLHFITIPPATNAREQEYIESSLLGADLLSSHLPNGLLVDYIGTPGPTTPSNQFHPQSTGLLDHHGSSGGGIQTYTAEDLQTLVDASSLQTSDNDRKMFLQFVNKPATQMSHEAPVIVTNAKDITSVNSISDHDKLAQPTHQQMTSVNHLPVATSTSNFLHYHNQDHLLNTAHTSVNNMVQTGNILTTLTSHNTPHHHQHHHHHHPHHQQTQTASHQIIQNAAQQHQQNQSHLSSLHSMLQGDCSPSKLFHVASSVASTSIAISTATSQNCIQMPPLAPLKCIESPKRYLSYQITQSQTPVIERDPTNAVGGDNFLSRDDLIECSEPRSEDEEDVEANTGLTSSNHFTNTYLPHKKRLSKKLGDSKNQSEQFNRNSVISNDHQSDQIKKLQQQSKNSIKENTKSFACQLCGESFEDQLMFFTHLKGHYEPVVGTSNDDGKIGDPKKKPKLPRVKHTKKLKNDKSSRIQSEDSSTCTNQPNLSLDAHHVSQDFSQETESCGYQQNNHHHGADVIVSPSHQPACTESDNAGEFSETEDMLEGIRNVVQKVQEAVDTDTNDGLVGTVERQVISNDEKAWYQTQHQHMSSNQTDIVKGIDFSDELDTQEIHINAGSDNFVLFLNKADFHEHDMLNHRGQAAQQPSHQSGQLTSSHNPSTSYILDADNQLQHPTIGECDIQNIQILDLGSASIENHDIAKLVDFNLSVTTAPLRELRGAKLLKDENKSNAENNTEVNDDDGFYVFDEGGDSEDSDVEANAGSEEEQTVTTNEEYAENVHTHPKEQSISSAPPCKKKGRKKLGGDLENETGEQAALKKPGKKYPCDEPDCDKVFNSKTAVRYHELQHKNERPYNCVQCPKNFFTSSALKVHERLHSGEKPYKCEECGRAFRQWGDMKYHQSSIHSNEKTHQCEFCGKKFARRYSLVLHRKIHLNEKNHVCDICNKAFRASSYLQSHRMIHTGEKPYSCAICSKKFRCGGDMKRHLKTHDRSKAVTSSKSIVVLEDDSHGKSSSSRTSTTVTRSSTTDVIDLTKIKSEGCAKVSSIQAPPVVTVLSKDISHVGKIANSNGQQLVYLTQAAGGQFRKPEETVLMDVARW